MAQRFQEESLFYIKNGFAIGGLDTHIYTGTLQEGKKDILFYYDALRNGSQR